MPGLMGLHPSGSFFRFCDGSVRFLRETMESHAFGYVSAKLHGEIIGAGRY